MIRLPQNVHPLPFVSLTIIKGDLEPVSLVAETEGEIASTQQKPCVFH
jgi:hypothetical protein